MNRPGLPQTAVAVATAIFFGAVAASARAQVPTSSSSGARASGIDSVRTLDADRDGRIDRVRVELDPGVPLPASASVQVAGYGVRRLDRRGRVIAADLIEHALPDTGATPLVTVRVRAGRAATRRARDGAPPVAVSAVAQPLADAVIIAWSEPVTPPAAGAVSDWTLPASSGHSWRPRAQRSAGASVWELQLAPGDRRPVAVDYRGRSVRDRAGNLARPFARSLSAAGSSTFPAITGATAAGGPSPATTAASVPAGAESSPTSWHVLENPISPWQQTALGFCDRSYWLQPWRAYLDTRPASSLADSLGINFNVAPADAATIAKLLAVNGFHHARLEEGWSEMSYADPTQIASPSGFVTRLKALQANGIRPLILLNADQGAPGPLQPVTLELAASAPAGARTVKLSPASIGSVVPGLTGFNDLSGVPMAAEDIITAVDATGTATLSKPLPTALAAGAHAGATLRFEPFAQPDLAGGGPNPRYEATLSGWLAYVDAVVHTARAALGGDGFDVEIWNELSSGAAFLSASNYYSPLPPQLNGNGSVPDALLSRTLSWLRDPANGLGGIGVTDGFASQTPFATGAGLPGLTALSKHPYAGPWQAFGPGLWGAPCRPLDAQGQPDGFQFGNWWLNAFTPSFVDYFPEYYLSAIQTEHLIREISPITTTISGVPHGRSVEPPVWVTETNIDSNDVPLTGADRWHMLAKATLRTLVSFVNKGISQLDFYAVWGSDFGLVDPSALAASGSTSGGAVIDAVGRTIGYMNSAGVSTPRSLSLLSVAGQGEAGQFQGDGTAGHPPLYNRDVLAAFPFQASDHSFVVPAYVMTRNIAQLYEPGAPSTDLARYDLPPEAFRLEIGGVDGANASVQAYDPLYDRPVAATIIARSASAVNVQLDLTDSPRLIRIDD